MNVGPKMKAVRELHGKKLQATAEQLSVTPGFLSLVEQGKRPAPDNLVAAWSELFFFDPETLADKELRISVRVA